MILHGWLGVMNMDTACYRQEGLGNSQMIFESKKFADLSMAHIMPVLKGWRRKTVFKQSHLLRIRESFD